MLLHFGFLLLLPAALGLMHLARGAMPKARAHRRAPGRLRPRDAARPAGDRLLRPRARAGAAARPSRSRSPTPPRADGWAPAVMGITGAFPVFFGLSCWCVAAWRAGAVAGLGRIA